MQQVKVSREIEAACVHAVLDNVVGSDIVGACILEFAVRFSALFNFLIA